MPFHVTHVSSWHFSLSFRESPGNFRNFKSANLRSCSHLIYTNTCILGMFGFILTSLDTKNTFPAKIRKFRKTGSQKRRISGETPEIRFLMKCSDLLIFLLKINLLVSFQWNYSVNMPIFNGFNLKALYILTKKFKCLYLALPPLRGFVTIIIEKFVTFALKWH